MSEGHNLALQQKDQHKESWDFKGAEAKLSKSTVVFIKASGISRPAYRSLTNQKKVKLIVVSGN